MEGRHKCAESGFSLVEMMVTVAIISLLGSIAIPNFQTMQLRAKRAEAPLMVNGILIAEKAYFQNYGTYVDAFVEPRDYDALNTQSVPWNPCEFSGGGAAGKLKKTAQKVSEDAEPAEPAPTPPEDQGSFEDEGSFEPEDEGSFEPEDDFVDEGSYEPDDDDFIDEGSREAEDDGDFSDDEGSFVDEEGEFCGWRAIGWQPDGHVYCNYEAYYTTIDGLPGVEVYAECDIDDDDEHTYFTGTSVDTVDFDIPGDELVF